VPLVLPLSILFPLFGGDEEQQKKKTQKQTQTTKRRSGSGWLTSVAKCLRPWTWVAFNVALLLFFGYLHQAGVVPSLLSLSSATPQADVRTSLHSSRCRMLWSHGVFSDCVHRARSRMWCISVHTCRHATSWPIAQVLRPPSVWQTRQCSHFPPLLPSLHADLVIHDVGGDATKLAAVLDLLAQGTTPSKAVDRAKHLT
jgi:hypothetical protein